MIVGARNDPEWGPVVLVGFGGVQAEVLRDVVLLAPDLTQAQIVSAIGGLKSAALLNGFRGAPVCDVDALAALVGRVSRLVRSEPSIAEIDLNPVMVLAAGEGVIALDALLVLGAGETTGQGQSK